MQNLVIVESPTKARTLSKFLGKAYVIEASMGHIRDLPKGELGVDIEHNFEPKYVTPRDKKKKVNELKKLASQAKTIWLATDPDREGEAISWHIQELIVDRKSNIVKSKNDKRQTMSKALLRINDIPIKRVVFHEITEGAIKEAFNHPRELDYKLVDAQQARRVLDRLVGYKLSPILWKKVKRGLSAGRVQTVALRLIVEREREIAIFVPVEYWSIEALLESRVKSLESRFTAALIELNGEKLEVHNKEEADRHVQALEKAGYSVRKVTKREVRRMSPAPFTTSTLQQASGNRLGYTAKRTMMLAQNLYEQGLITYMRTDSVILSQTALVDAREYINHTFGQDYLPASPRIFKSKSKNAQEAHEAIRPTNIKASPEKMDGEGLTRDHKRLYELIWRRTLASQMKEALMDQTTIDVKAESSAVSHQLSDIQKSDDRRPTTDSYTLRATGSVLKFDGWLKVYGKGKGSSHQSKTGTEGQEEPEQLLPEVSENQPLDLIKLDPEQHFTEPSPRYTEASLIKKLEELGIGRPSTYAPILSTIQDRFYVERQEKKFVATDLGMTVADFLIKYFPDVFDYEFTAVMEDQLDEIARGERNWQATIGEFYKPLGKKLAETELTAEKVELAIEKGDHPCPECGKDLIVRTGKFGKFLACLGFPDCKHTEAIEEKIDAQCPQDGGLIVLRKTKKGRTFYGCKNYPNCTYASWTKPKGEKDSTGTTLGQVEL